MRKPLKITSIFVIGILVFQTSGNLAYGLCNFTPLTHLLAQRVQTDFGTKELLREIENEGQYTVRRVEYEGDTVNGLYRKLRRRTLIDEGDIFTRRNLEQTIENFNNLKDVEGMSLKDVVLTLDRTKKTVIIRFIVRLRKR